MLFLGKNRSLYWSSLKTYTGARYKVKHSPWYSIGDITTFTQRLIGPISYSGEWPPGCFSSGGTPSIEPGYEVGVNVKLCTLKIRIKISDRSFVFRLGYFRLPACRKRPRVKPNPFNLILDCCVILPDQLGLTLRWGRRCYRKEISLALRNWDCWQRPA